jgi:hypothetical protein
MSRSVQKKRAMRHVSIPEPLYTQAQRVAVASGMSIEAFVLEALQLRIEEDGPIKLSKDQAEIIARAEAEIDAGNFLTAQQVREHFTQKKAAWTQDSSP